MVSEDADFRGAVGEAFVESGHHRLEVDILSAVGEDGFEALYLLFAIGEDIDGKPLFEEPGEALRDELEIFMIDGLRGAFEVDRYLSLSISTASGGESQLPAIAEGGYKLLRVGELLHGAPVGVLIGSHQGTVRELLRGYGADAAGSVVSSRYCYQRVGVEIVEKRHP